MSNKPMVEDLQKQDPASELIHLFELELSSSSTVYFHDGTNTSLGNVTFDGNTYLAMPVKASGFKLSAGGKNARPSFTFGNVENVFSGAVNMDYDLLIGKKITRRTTLNKYLSSNPAVEYPKQVFFIDRIQSRDKVAVSFECATPYDLEGIMIPHRQIISNACSWIYTGADPSLAEKNRNGGCTWRRNGEYRPVYKPGTTGLSGDTNYVVLVNVDDEYVVPGTGETGAVTFSTHSTGAVTINGYYKNTTTLGTSSGVRRLTKAGAIDTGADSSTVNNYWQATVTSSSPGTATDSNSNFNRIRIWDTWSSSTTYYAFTDDRYNDYVRHTSGGLTRLWKAKRTSLNQSPDFGDFWELGDMCSKSLTGCKMRYGFEPINAGTSTSTGKAKTNTGVVLPYGGFPAARGFN